MNFTGNDGGFSANVKPASTSGFNSLNFNTSISGFSPKIKSISVGQTARMYDSYEEIDYSNDVEVSVAEDVVTSDKNLQFNSDESSKFQWERQTDGAKPSAASKITFDTIIWASTKGSLTEWLHTSNASIGTVILAAFIEGAYKGVLQGGSNLSSGVLPDLSVIFGQTSVKGTTKAFVSFLLKNKPFLNVAQFEINWAKTSFVNAFEITRANLKKLTSWNSIPEDGMKKLLQKAGLNKVSDAFSKTFDVIKTQTGNAVFELKEMKDFFDKKIFSKEVGVYEKYNGSRLGGKNGALVNGGYTAFKSFGSLLSKFGITLGIDYLGTVAANYVSASINKGFGNAELSDLKLGSSFLKSSTKIICATAGEMIGGKTGKVVGTIVGSIIGDYQVQRLGGDETWCAIAGAAQIVGAVAFASFYVFIASNPVGWAVGAAMICGAVVGFCVTAIIYDLTKVDWDAVGAKISSGFNTAVNWVSDRFEEAGESLRKLGDAVGTAVVTGFNTAVNWASDRLEEAGKALKETAETVGTVVATGFDNAVNWASDRLEEAGKALKETAETVGTVLDTVNDFAVDTLKSGVKYVAKKYNEVSKTVGATLVHVFSFGWL